VDPGQLRTLALQLPGVARGWNAHKLRRSQFTGRLTHLVTVPPDADGRPGERLVAPSLPFFRPTMAACGSRNDLVVALGPRTRLTVVCLGRIADRGDPWTASKFTIGEVAKLGIPCVAGPSLTMMAGEHAVSYGLLLASGALVTEWKFHHAGWLYVVGIRRRPGDDPAASALGAAVLETWRWIEPAPAA